MTEETATHYNILGVSSTASYEEIKAAFYSLARQSHPDKQQQPASNTNTTIAFKQVQKAWETLRDTSSRTLYDQQLLQLALNQKAKCQGAIVISKSDLEEALDDETQESLWVYDCRCGEEVILEHPKLLVECPGCCFVYKVEMGDDDDKNAATTTNE